MSKLSHSFGDLPPNQKEIAKLNPANSMEFFRVIYSITKNFGTWHCDIRDSIISQPIGMSRTFLIHLVLKKVIGESVNMSFVLNQKQLKNFSGQTDTSIIHDEEKQIYIIRIGSITEVLNVISNSSQSYSIPSFDQNDYIGTQINNINIKEIKNYIGKLKVIQLLIYENQLEQIVVLNKFPYTFKGTSLGILKDKQPDIKLLSSKFLSLVGKKNNSLKLAKNTQGVWLITESKLSLTVNITTYELLN